MRVCVQKHRHNKFLLRFSLLLKSIFQNSRLLIGSSDVNSTTPPLFFRQGKVSICRGFTSTWRGTCSVSRTLPSYQRRVLTWVECICALVAVSSSASQHREIARQHTSQLSGTPEEWKEVVVVETPHAMGACWLKPIRRLYAAHDANVAPEDAQDDGGAVVAQ